MMNPGNFRHYVDIVAPGGARTDRGQIQAEHYVMRNVPASIEFLSGREAEVARQMLPTASSRISMRGPIKGLTAQCAIVEKSNGSIHHVGFVQDDSRVGQLYRCLCEQEAL